MARKKAKKKNYRDAQVTIIFGKNGTGKSYLCKDIVSQMGGRAVVVTYAGMPKIWRGVPVIDAKDPNAWKWDKGLRQIIAAEYDHPTKDSKNYVFEYIFKYFKNGTVIFDDCREYIVTNRITDYPYLKKILSAFRHKELDLFFVMHSPGDVPKQVWMYTSTTFVGHTNAIIKESDLRIGTAAEIVRVQPKIKKEFLRRKKLNNGSHYGLFVKIDS